MEAFAGIGSRNLVWNNVNLYTSQALRIAKDYNIPIFNLFHEDCFDKLKAFLIEQKK